jgi:hypothetical protein
VPTFIVSRSASDAVSRTSVAPGWVAIDVHTCEPSALKMTLLFAAAVGVDAWKLPSSALSKTTRPGRDECCSWPYSPPLMS